MPVQYFLTAFRWIEPFVLLFIFWAIFAGRSSQFTSSANLATIATTAAPLILLALGMLLTMLIGGIDLSVSAIAAFTSMVFASLVAKNAMSGSAGIVVALLFGFLIGLINGTLSVVFRVPAFAVTLAMAAVLRGFVANILGGQDIFTKDTSLDFLAPKPNTFPASFVISVGIALLIWAVLLIWWFLRTRRGMSVSSIGGRRLSPRAVIIVIRLLAISAFALSGVLAAFAGLIDTARLHGATTTNFTGIEIMVLAAVVIGSVSLLGGMGNAVSVVGGALVITVLLNGPALNGGLPNAVLIIPCILLVAAAINTPLNLVERWLKQRQWMAKQMKPAGQ